MFGRAIVPKHSSSQSTLDSLLCFHKHILEIVFSSQFLKYVYENKVMNLRLSDWNYVLQRWPYQTKDSLLMILDIVSVYCKRNHIKSCPLYQQVSHYLSHPWQDRKSYYDQRRAILKMYDELRMRTISKE